MSRVVQPEGNRGSLKWIQQYVNQNPSLLDAEIIPKLDGAQRIVWLSPLATDQYAEYRDTDFLNLLKISHLSRHLQAFWPQRGPQWDAIARTERDDVLLIEAKAHIGELRSPASAAGAVSLEKIRAALGDAATVFGAHPDSPWHLEFYQLANRLAHLQFLRKQGVAAWLVLINFVGDHDMRGPATVTEWEAAYEAAFRTLGIAHTAPALRHVLHIYPDVRKMA